MTKMRYGAYLLVVSLVLFLHGCSSGPLERGQASPEAITPVAGKALIIFLRPASGITIVDYQRAALFMTKNVGSEPDLENDPEIIGILRAKTKLAYQVDPGRHLFMVIGESADFMSADVLPNRTYYALVLASPGKRVPVFSLKALNKQEWGSSEFKDLVASASWIAKTSDALNYAASNMPDIRSREYDGYQVWSKKPASERQALLPEYGTTQ